MVIADFTTGVTKVYTKSLFQYDKGQRLGFEGIIFPEQCEVHFSNNERNGISYAVKLSNESVKIPDIFLRTGEYIYAWFYATEVSQGSKGGVRYHFEDDPTDPETDDRLVVDSVTSSKQAFDRLMTLYEVVIPVQKRPDIFKFQDENDDDDADSPEKMEIDIDGENAIVVNTGNDGTGKPTIQNFVIEGETLRFF